MASVKRLPLRSSLVTALRCEDTSLGNAVRSLSLRSSSVSPDRPAKSAAFSEPMPLAPKSSEATFAKLSLVTFEQFASSCPSASMMARRTMPLRWHTLANCTEDCRTVMVRLLPMSPAKTLVV